MLKVEVGKQKKNVLKARHAVELEDADDPNSDESIRCKAELKAAQSNASKTTQALEREVMRMALLATAHYPELRHLHPEMQLDRFIESAGVERAFRDLSCYSDMVKLSNDGSSSSNHELFSVMSLFVSW